MKNSGVTFLEKYAKFNVSKLTKITFILPLIVVLIAIAVIVGVGETTGNYTSAIGIGIDFQGGTMLTVNGLEDNEELQATIDSVEQTIESVQDANGSRVTVSYIQRLSGGSGISVTFRYQNVSGNDNEINDLNNAIIAAVGEQFYPDGEVPDGFITYESIGATAAQDLLSKAGIALAVSTVLILIYIVIRFTPTAAFAAVLALLHDVIVMFALTVICRVQINSSFVAAMITIIAYSINNTIIIFDVHEALEGHEEHRLQRHRRRLGAREYEKKRVHHRDDDDHRHLPRHPGQRLHQGVLRAHHPRSHRGSVLLRVSCHSHVGGVHERLGQAQSQARRDGGLRPRLLRGRRGQGAGLRFSCA